MTWEYDQSIGELRHNGQLFQKGYSGNGAGINNPAMESVRGHGPIPKGYYRISGSHDTITPVTIILDPILGTNTFGRSLFRIHGGKRNGERTASDGCIIIDGVSNRQHVLNSGDTILVVR